MPEPVTDRHDVDAALEQMTSGGMAHHMGVYAPACEAADRLGRRAGVLAQDVPYAVPTERLAVAVAEQRPCVASQQAEVATVSWTLRCAVGAVALERAAP